MTVPVRSLALKILRHFGHIDKCNTAFKIGKDSMFLCVHGRKFHLTVGGGQ